MANGTIGLPLDGVGKKLDTEQLSVASVTVQRERMQLCGALALEITQVRNDNPLIGDYGVVVRPIEVADPQTVQGIVTTIAAGSSGTIDSPNITGGRTGKLVQLHCSASVPFKVEFFTVLNNIATLKVVGFSLNRQWELKPRSKELFTVAEDAGAGLDGFRVTLTNLDTSEAADLYATICYDEG